MVDDGNFDGYTLQDENGEDIVEEEISYTDFDDSDMDI